MSACSGGSDQKTGTIQNRAPTAKIELDAPSILLGDSVTINGDTSSDPDGDSLSYQWNIKTETGDDYQLVNNGVEEFLFTPENFGTYIVSLIVKDEALNSEMVTSTIMVEPNEQSYPIAIVSDDMTNKVGKVSWFSGEQSSAADGQLLAYQWQLESKPATSNSTIGDETKVNGYFIADVAGTYQISLTVTNTENQLTATEVLTIVVEELLINSAPVAMISAPMPSYTPNQSVRLNATDSYDSDGDTLTYQWRLELPPTASDSSLIGDTTEFVEFYVSDIGDYQITLEVSDGKLSSETTQTITVADQNISPVANAGADQLVILGLAYELDGTASSDADELEYKWSLISKPETSSYSDLSNSSYTSYGKFSFVADVTGGFVFALQVFDGLNYSVVDQVYIEATENQRPVAVLPNDIAVNTGGSITALTTQSYDPEGRPLTYAWQLISVPSGSLAEFITVDNLTGRTFLPDLEGTYTVQLVVNDGIQDSLPATINFIYEPAVWHELTITGQLVDEAGIPITMIEVGGMLQVKATSDDNGYFEVKLKSREKDAGLSVLTLTGENILSTILKTEQTDQQQLELGEIILPVLQQKSISLTACPSYSGTEKIDVYFYLTNDGYNNMRFYKPVVAEFTLGQAPLEVKLPATGVINMRLSTSVAGQVSVENGDSFFTNQYQAHDSEVAQLAITICN